MAKCVSGSVITHDQLDTAYATPGLSHDASSSAVKRQYKALVRKWHPDRFTGDPQGVAEATVILKALNHAFSTILESRSSRAFTPHSDSSSDALVSHRFEGTLTQTQIDEMVAAIRHSESLLTVVSKMTWRDGVRAPASLLLALAYTAAAWTSGEIASCRYWCVTPLLCIWFPDVLGAHIGVRITKPSPPLFVWFFWMGALTNASARSRNHLAKHAVVATNADAVRFGPTIVSRPKCSSLVTDTSPVTAPIANGSRRFWLSFAVAAVHLCVCVATRIRLLESEGSWAWFPVFLVDFPFSILLLPLLKIADPLLVFGLLGSAWWFLISRLGVYALRRAINYLRRG
jgi:hypothetical protein